MVRSAGQVLKQTLVTKSAEVAAIADGIAEYQLPAGYSEQYGMSLLGFSLVAYAPSDSHSHIMLMQIPAIAGLDQAEMERQMRQATQQQTHNEYLRLETVGQSKATIRGQEVTLIISEGVNRDGQPYRALAGVFQGKGGPRTVTCHCSPPHGCTPKPC